MTTHTGSAGGADLARPGYCGARSVRVVTITTVLMAVMLLCVMCATPAFATKKPTKAAAKRYLVRKNPMHGKHNIYTALAVLKSGSSYWVIATGFQPGASAALGTRATFAIRRKGTKWRLVAQAYEEPFSAATMAKLPRKVRSALRRLKPWTYWE